MPGKETGEIMTPASYNLPMRWIRRHWLALLGLTPLLPPLIKAVLQLIGLGGSIDFLIARYDDPAWVGRMIGFLIDPPGWSIVPMILIGLLLIWWDFRRRTSKDIAVTAKRDWWDKRAAEFDERYRASTRERGILDFILDGVQALKDVTTILNASNKETANFSKRILSYTSRFASTKNLHKKRKILIDAASYINSYSANIKKAAALIEQATIVIRETQIGFLEKAPVGTRSAVEELITYRTVLRTTAEAATKSALQIDGMRQASLALKGVSGELNEASTNLFSVLSALIEKIERYSEMAREIESIVAQKLATADSVV
jgi:hypothetical protein